MELFKKVKIKFPTPLKDLYKLNDVCFGEVNYQGKIIVAFVSFVDIKSLAKSWKEINSYITTYYFSELEDEFSKWNSYVFYMIPSDIDKPLKYDIENNKFSSRKIVIDNFMGNLSDKEVVHIIEQHITCTNMKIEVTPPKIPDFKKNKSFSKIIDELNIPTKGKEEVLKETLVIIENTLKNEV